MAERDFVEQLTKQFPVRPPVETGIGDDGAVLTNSDGSKLVVVTDMLLDGVHFDVANTPAGLLGRKAVAVNLSDLAAMGCRPTAAFVSIAVPGLVRSIEFLNGLYGGIQGLSEQFGFTLAGGDTNSWDGPFAINVCMTGAPYGDRAILRSGAQPGDSLLVTGALGGSLSAGRHLSFEPRLDVARQLATELPIHAIIDISDGLAIDLHRMMDASGTGAIVTENDVPIHDDVPSGLSRQDRLTAALSDGEDFELLIAAPPESVQAACRLTDSRGESLLSVIGTVTEERGCRMTDAVDGTRELSAEGWQHG